MHRLIGWTIATILALSTSAAAQFTVFVPNCAGTDDTAKFTSLITTIGANTGTIRLPYKNGTRCAVNTLTIPDNITLDNGDGTGIKVNAAQTLTVLGPVVGPVGKAVFFGPGTIVFTGNTHIGSSGQALLSDAAGNWSFTNSPQFLSTGMFSTKTITVAPDTQTYAAYSGASESGPGFFIHRVIAAEASDNEHGFVDATQFGRLNRAYAAFDSQPVFTGTNNYDHVVNFQARAHMNSSGTLSNYYGFFNFPTTSQGTITNMYGFYASSGSAVALSIINRYAFVSESNAGPVGIGTITPTHRLTIGANETPVSTASIFGAYNSGNAHGIFRDTVNDIELSIGTDSATGGFLNMNTNHPLAFSAANATRLTLSSSGVRFNGYGAGTLVTDASGNITASSDGRLKNVHGSFTRGLSAIRRINPVLFSWRPESGMETEGVYAGVTAQNLRIAVPEAVATGPDGTLTVQDRPVIMALVNAVKELEAEVESLRRQVRRLQRRRR